MSLAVLEPGFHTLVVDRGRRSTRHLGVPLGGAADRAAAAIANGLVGNPPDLPTLEITLLGPTLRAEVSTACALFGAPFQSAIANKGRITAGSVFQLEAGDVLKIAGTPQGVRAYLAVAGGFDSPCCLGSRSGLETLAAGTVLPCQPSRLPVRSLAFEALPITSDDGAVRLRFLPGPQQKYFLDPTLFLSARYEVAPASDRMGLRLIGPALERRAGELVSEAVAPGAVQITNDGLPVVLGIDGQTIGGYPKIAHVIRADLDTLAQLRPGMFVKFVKVSDAEAQAAAVARRALVSEWLTRLAVTSPRLQ